MWARVGGYLQAESDAWIGITGRATGAAELQKFDSVRYAEIDFPSNDLGWDMLRDVGVPVSEVQPHSDIEDFAAKVDSVTFVNSGSASVRRAVPAVPMLYMHGSRDGALLPEIGAQVHLTWHPGLARSAHRGARRLGGRHYLREP